MQHPLAMVLLVACVPIIVAACRRFGPGPSARFAILGVFLAMPRYDPLEKVFGVFTFDKLTVAGPALLLGVLLFDRKTLFSARPRWVDLPMALYVTAPLIGLLAGRREDVWGSVDQAWMTMAGWGIPYALGRLYYSDPEGPRRVATATVAAALLYIPFCAFEAAMGEEWYLRPLIFGIPTVQGDFRLGGWRPSVMLTTGLELATWMALATVLAFRLWACRERQRPLAAVPAWVPPLALLAATIACRGAYSYLTLAAGLLTVAALLLTGSRLMLAPLMVVPPLYIGLRVSGLWDGHQLGDLAALAGTRAASSIRFRLEIFETSFIRDAFSGSLAFGMGGRYSSSWADGWWLMLLKRGGLLAMVAHYAAFLLPAGLVLWRKGPARPGLAAAETGLALFLLLQMVDSLHNTSLIAVSTLAGGALAGAFLGRASGTKANTGRAEAEASSAHATYRLRDIAESVDVRASAAVDVPGRLGFVLSIACLLYVFGHGRVDGQEGAMFVGGLAAGLLFAAAGAAVASFRRLPGTGAVGFGLAFAVLGVSFNLALHPSSRPVGSADILQGLALCGLVAAGWRRATGGGSLAFAALAALAAAWWAIEPWSRPFWGSQYLFASGIDGLSLFPLMPWLSLAALGAALIGQPPAVATTTGVVLGLAGLTSWGGGLPFGPPIKFPLNPTYALLGGSLASVAFAASGLVQGSKSIRSASVWLGHRWLVFFYLHMGIAVALGRLGLTTPWVCWTVLATTSLVATWIIGELGGRLGPAFRHPATWALLAAWTIVVGFAPGLPTPLVVAFAGLAGVLFAAGLEGLASLTLGPKLEWANPAPRPRSAGEGELPVYLAKVALAVAVVVAPEVVGRISRPSPGGRPPATEARPVDADGPTRSPRMDLVP